jgi:hypothetical protein
MFMNGKHWAFVPARWNTADGQFVPGAEIDTPSEWVETKAPKPAQTFPSDDIDAINANAIALDPRVDLLSAYGPPVLIASVLSMVMGKSVVAWLATNIFATMTWHNFIATLTR